MPPSPTPREKIDNLQANDAWTSHVVTDGVLDTTQDDFDFLEEIVSAAEKGPEVFLSFLEYLYESDKQLDIVSIASLLFRSATLRLRLPEQLVHYIATSLRRTDDTGEMMMARDVGKSLYGLQFMRGDARTTREIVAALAAKVDSGIYDPGRWYVGISKL